MGILIFFLLLLSAQAAWLSCGGLNIGIILKHQRQMQISTENGNDSNLLIVFYVQIMPDDFVMQLHR
ncbi:hypothetical protein P2N87_12730, partial [Escherichia coli]